MKKNNTLIIIAILVAVVLFTQQDTDNIITFEDNLQAISTRTSLQSCVDYHDDRVAEGKCVSDCAPWTNDVQYCAEYHRLNENGGGSSLIDPTVIGKYYLQYEDSCPPYTSIRERELYECTLGIQTMPDYPFCVVDEQCTSNERCVLNTLTCQPSTCQDSDGGLNYFTKGTVTTAGGYTTSDICVCSQQSNCNPNDLIETYCDGDQNRFLVYTCPEGCSNGACIGAPDCNTNADTNCDGSVSRLELGEAITDWISGSISRTELGQAIVAWVGG